MLEGKTIKKVHPVDTDKIIKIEFTDGTVAVIWVDASMGKYYTYEPQISVYTQI